MDPTGNAPIYVTVGTGGESHSEGALHKDAEWVAARDHTTFGAGQLQFRNATHAYWERLLVLEEEEEGEMEDDDDANRKEEELKDGVWMVNYYYNNQPQQQSATTKEQNDNGVELDDEDRVASVTAAVS